MLGDIGQIICNPIYMTTTLIVTSMYFSGTGLQFWTIQYISIVMNTEPITA